MLKILVTGKNGYVSRNFQNYMKRYPEIKVDAVSVRNGAWKNHDFGEYSAVFNTAGLAHNDARKGTDEQFMELNAKLPVELAEKAKADGVRSFINMSSIIIYGDASALGKARIVTEKTEPEPAGIYGKSKLEGEKGLKKLADETFHVAVIRSPLIYGEDAVDNFLKLTDFAVRSPVFPSISNARSMIYTDNLCELVRLIAINESSGIFCPQQDVYICTSRLVKDVALASGHKMVFTKIFNPALYFLSEKTMFIRKVFGSLAYDMEMSDYFDGKYRVVSYKESIERLAERRRGFRVTDDR